MSLRLALVGLATVTLAVAAVSVSAPVARAFTFESGTNADGSSKFADPDDQASNFGGNGVQIGGQGGPIVQFGAQSQPGTPMSPMISPFNHFMGGGGNVAPPQPYAMPLGNGD